MTTLVGQKAPNFTCEAVMPDGSFDTVSLGSFLGQKYVLLFFYPFDFTFVCPSEIVAFSKAVKDFEARDVQVLGCSIDSKFTHHAWRSQDLKNGGIGPVSIPLLADVKKEVASAYGVLLPDGMALRGLFLIDKQGVVQHALVNSLAIGRSVPEALRVVDALQHHEKYGDVCPANWQKGEKAMKPTAKGVAEYLGALH
ncbi:peroxiredoxin, putative [Eimeria brunetti]|uniref:Peroxiredoxin, putative n=1 Tax=Eimeria brunetti TaxID=51314 RepID=U6LLQ4_9EIME|nr:peroxiredoxin, putative [Eimeria brunetti]